MSPRGVLVVPEEFLPGPTPQGGTPSGTETGAPDRSYKRIYWSSSGGSNSGNPKSFPFAGDHLTITKMVGTSVWVQLNQKNEYIEIREGDVLTRDFNNVTFLCLAAINPVSNQQEFAEVEAYVSVGPLLQRRAPKTYGVRSQPYMAYFKGVGVNGISVPDLPGIFSPTFFKWGGTMVVLNDDAANTLWLVWRDRNVPNVGGPVVVDPATSPRNQFPIGPKQSLTIVFDDRVQAFFDIGSGLQSVAHTSLVIAPFAGTCDAAIFVSSLDVDLGDAFASGPIRGEQPY